MLFPALKRGLCVLLHCVSTPASPGQGGDDVALRDVAVTGVFLA